MAPNEIVREPTAPANGRGPRSRGNENSVGTHHFVALATAIIPDNDFGGPPNGVAATLG